MKTLLHLQDLQKSFGQQLVLNHVGFELQSGEIIGLIGPSGAGKSSLIRLFYQEEKLTSGSMKVGEFDLTRLRKKDVPLLRRSIGVVFQDYKLLPKKTAFENVAYAMEVIGEKPRHIKKRVAEVLELVGLKHKMRSFPNQLSGGEQQRVAIARAVAKNPKILLCDEPTGALDYQTGKQILTLLQEMARKQGTTVIIVTHNASLAPIADRVIRMHDAKIKSVELNPNPQKIEDLEY